MGEVVGDRLFLASLGAMIAAVGLFALIWGVARRDNPDALSSALAIFVGGAIGAALIWFLFALMVYVFLVRTAE